MLTQSTPLQAELNKPMAISNRSGLLILLILLLAFGLRLYKSGAYGLYLDEKYTMVISQGIVMEGSNQHDVFFTPGKTYFTPREFWKPKMFSDFIEANIRNDIGNSPAYYAVLWTWIKLFGITDFSVRFPSVLFSTLIAGLVYLFVRHHLRSETLALMSAFLAAVEPFFIAYSHMARNYSMSFFLTLLATHLFLLILEKDKNRKSPTRLLIAYGITFVLCLLSHYLTLTVFLSHGLYFLLYVRKPKLWLAFALTALAGLGLVSLWFIFGGGSYTFQTLAYQAKFYRNIALTNPYNSGFGLVLPATLFNVAERSMPIWSDLFILTNSLFHKAVGYRNILVSLVLGLGALGLFSRYYTRRHLPWWVLGAFTALMVAGLPFYIAPRPNHVVIVAIPTFCYLLVVYIRQSVRPEQRSLLVFLLLLAVVPTLFLLLMSFRNGHTYGITQRYSGFSFPYTVILVSMILYQVYRLPNAFKVVLSLVLLVQAYLIGSLLHTIYSDRDPKYTYFAKPRTPNPHYLSAQRIREAYAPGDTVLYPSIRLYARDEIEKTFWPFSIQDAQLTNLYLPKEADYIQRMDTTQSDRIILVKGRTGQKITIFDFEGTTYRY
ncbi:hypothetical protein GCM10023189_36100 [Nibrella saemangeumensis]|uniref:Glycosyltransferase RgtA/B/C/D-like domain-containing protein n=1 Tax=Nibrella saemangeumensis TaxID=1084526 RepID=A0ABP8N6E7_9BACT